MFKYDLHNHSNYSDGELSPIELIQYAHQRGVKLLALTDHDTVKGIAEARKAAEQCGILFIAGVELSARWEAHDIHIVGLKVDSENPQFLERLDCQLNRRIRRAKQIANQLAQIGIPGSLEGAQTFAGAHCIARPHFAKYLIKQKITKDFSTAFRHYLGKGTSGYVPTHWPEMAEAITWIQQAGGQAVLAHPKRYKLNNQQLRKLCAAFKQAGGDGIEVITASHTLGEVTHVAQLAHNNQLLASQGADFHGPSLTPFFKDKYLQIPANVTPIWHNWPLDSIGKG